MDLPEFLTGLPQLDAPFPSDVVKTHALHSADGLMVIFKEGSLESHAIAAVKAGLDIVQENNRVNDEFSYPWGRVNLLLEINSGEAVTLNENTRPVLMPILTL